MDTASPPISPTSAAATAAALPAEWRDFFALTKPRVMTLVIFTAICGVLAAPGSIHPVLGFTAILAISMGAGGSAALNQWWEADIDKGMKRTMNRPLPAGRMRREDARDFGIFLSAVSVCLMGVAIGWLAAALLLGAIIYYAVIYTMWLKPRTPQNIVIGGGAGAFPPLIGWIAVTGEITAMPVLLFAIIFFWTPPHFWALAIFRRADYSRAQVPMLPVTHGVHYTRLQILLYTILLTVVTVLPWVTHMSGGFYLGGALVLNAVFLYYAVRLMRPPNEAYAMKVFNYSIIYLMALFAFLLADRWLLPYGVVPAMP